jgi:hypothetical protein
MKLPSLAPEASASASFATAAYLDKRSSYTFRAILSIFRLEPYRKRRSVSMYQAATSVKRSAGVKMVFVSIPFTLASTT